MAKDTVITLRVSAKEKRVFEVIAKAKDKTLTELLLDNTRATENSFRASMTLREAVQFAIDLELHQFELEVKGQDKGDYFVASYLLSESNLNPLRDMLLGNKTVYIHYNMFYCIELKDEVMNTIGYFW